MAVQFVNTKTQEIATMSADVCTAYTITDAQGNFVRTITEGSKERVACTRGDWKIVRTSEAKEWYFTTLMAQVTNKAMWQQICDKMWAEGVDAVPASKKFQINGTKVTELATGLTFECAQPNRFVAIAEKSTFTYAQYRWNRAEVLKAWGVKKVAEGVVQFETKKKGDGSKVSVVMQALEMNMGMYSQMLQHDLELLLNWDSSNEIEVVRTAHEEMIVSSTKSLDGAKYDASRLFSNTICGIVLSETTLEAATHAKKVWNKSSKTQAKDMIAKKLGLATSRLRSYVLGN
jgi:hypothetical protein